MHQVVSLYITQHHLAEKKAYILLMGSQFPTCLQYNSFFWSMCTIAFKLQRFLGFNSEFSFIWRDLCAGINQECEQRTQVPLYLSAYGSKPMFVNPQAA